MASLHFRLLGIILLIIQAFASCTPTKKLTEEAIYFKNTSDSLLASSPLEYKSLIQKGDILYIAVNTANEASARLLNQQNFYAGSNISAGASSSGGATPVGYLVDEEGAITFPYIGKVAVAGKTKSEARDTISTLIRKYVDDAIVSLRLLNYKVTILGEVARPGSYSIPSERVTILDALGLAGDLTVFGKRDNVKVIRESGGKREMGILNLGKGDIFNS